MEVIGRCQQGQQVEKAKSPGKKSWRLATWGAWPGLPQSGFSTLALCTLGGLLGRCLVPGWLLRGFGGAFLGSQLRMACAGWPEGGRWAKTGTEATNEGHEMGAAKGTEADAGVPLGARSGTLHCGRGCVLGLVDLPGKDLACSSAIRSLDACAVGADLTRQRQTVSARHCFAVARKSLFFLQISDRSSNTWRFRFLETPTDYGSQFEQNCLWQGNCAVRAPSGSLFSLYFPT